MSRRTLHWPAAHGAVRRRKHRADAAHTSCTQGNGQILLTTVTAASLLSDVVRGRGPGAGFAGAGRRSARRPSGAGGEPQASSQSRTTFRPTQVPGAPVAEGVRATAVRPEPGNVPGTPSRTEAGNVYESRHPRLAQSTPGHGSSPGFSHLPASRESVPAVEHRESPATGTPTGRRHEHPDVTRKASPMRARSPGRSVPLGGVARGGGSPVGLLHAPFRMAHAPKSRRRRHRTSTGSKPCSLTTDEQGADGARHRYCETDREGNSAGGGAVTRRWGRPPRPVIPA